MARWVRCRRCQKPLFAKRGVLIVALTRSGRVIQKDVRVMNDPRIGGSKLKSDDIPSGSNRDAENKHTKRVTTCRAQRVARPGVDDQIWSPQLPVGAPLR